jgi:hypothetical protein
MTEIKFLQKQVGNDIIIANKNFGTEVGTIHICGDNYKIDDIDKEFSHLSNALEALLNQKSMEC